MEGNMINRSAIWHMLVVGFGGEKLSPLGIFLQRRWMTSINAKTLMQCEVSSRKAVHAGSTCVTCECRSRGTPEVLGTMSRVCRERGIHFSKAKPPEGHEESAGRLLPSAQKAPADEANGASVLGRSRNERRGH